MAAELDGGFNISSMDLYWYLLSTSPSSYEETWNLAKKTALGGSIHIVIWGPSFAILSGGFAVFVSFDEIHRCTRQADRVKGSR